MYEAYFFIFLNKNVRCLIILLQIKDGYQKNFVRVSLKNLFGSKEIILHVELHNKNLKKKNYKLNIDGTDQRDLDQAIENSLHDFTTQQNDDCNQYC